MFINDWEEYGKKNGFKGFQICCEVTNYPQLEVTLSPLFYKDLDEAKRRLVMPYYDQPDRYIWKSVHFSCDLKLVLKLYSKYNYKDKTPY